MFSCRINKNLNIVSLAKAGPKFASSISYLQNLDTGLRRYDKVFSRCHLLHYSVQLKSQINSRLTLLHC